MTALPLLLRLALALGLALPSACATPRAQALPQAEQQQEALHTEASPQGSASPSSRNSPWTRAPATELQQARASAGAATWAEPLPVLLHELPAGRLRLSFPQLPLHPDMERLSVEDIRPFLVAFRSLAPPTHPPLRLLLESPHSPASGRRPPAPWELRLREDFFSLYGPPLLPLPESLESSRFALALRLSTRYMGEGVREAAQELFSAPAFLASVTLSVLVYFACWLAPEPLFSKAFAASLTVRLALLVGLVELDRLARACLLLYEEAEAATSPQEFEAASARFGRAAGGTFLRLLVVVASLGVPQVLPQVPQGGVWTLLSPARHAPAAGPALEFVTSAAIVADGTLVVTGVAAGTAASSLCGELALCATSHGGAGSSGARTALSTRYGRPHTRQNPPHNEAIEQELARREAAGHTDLRKNKAQRDATGAKAYDPRKSVSVRYRKPDVSSVRPDGVRHNTNYVSEPRDMRRELEAFDAMVQADKTAVHELYRLDGTLVRRYVPPGVSFP